MLNFGCSDKIEDDSSRPLLLSVCSCLSRLNGFLCDTNVRERNKRITVKEK